MSDCFHYGTDSPHDTPECYPCCKHCHACGVKLDDSTPPDCPGVVKCPQCDRRVANQNDEGIHNTGECGCEHARALCWSKWRGGECAPLSPYDPNAPPPEPAEPRGGKEPKP